MLDVMDAIQGGLGHGLINAQPKADLHEPAKCPLLGEQRTTLDFGPRRL
jgi:hypothetical protein